MPLYEVELRGDDVIEERLTDRPLEVGSTVTIGSRDWVVAQARAARDGARALRFICVEAREDAEALKAALAVRRRRAAALQADIKPR